MAASGLELAGISHAFAGVPVLKDVSLQVAPGSVHALLGENGAGKSTLMRIAFGMLAPDRGTIQVDGAPLRAGSTRDAIAHGVGMVHQHFTLVPSMTVAENIALGGRGRMSAKIMRARVATLCSETGFALEPDARVGALPVSAQQRVEIMKAIGRGARYLILDEPTAVLAPGEIDDLLAWIRRFVSGGSSVVLITHKLREALAVADEVTVLRAGRVALTARAAGATPGMLTVAMLGAADVPTVASIVPAHMRGAVVPTLELRDVLVPARAGNPSLVCAEFTAMAGEITGVVGLEGAGHQVLLRVLAGRTVAERGLVHRPSHVGFIPDDRHADAVVLDATLTANVELRGLQARRGLMAWAPARRRTAELMLEHDVRATGPDSHMRDLSGGNQQKLVVARELAPPPDLSAPWAVIAENPARGLDVRAAAAVHARLHEAAQRGAAVVVYSSDLDEVLALATSMYVACAGTVVSVPHDRDRIGRALLGIV